MTFLISKCCLCLISSFAHAQVAEPIVLTTMPVSANCKARCISEGNFDITTEAMNVLKATEGGASTVFLVRGDVFADAVGNTIAVFRQAQSAAVPVGINSNAISKYWLVVYLGMTSSNTTLDSIEVERNGNAVTVTYSQMRGARRDIAPQFVWLPLGELRQSNYKLTIRHKDTAEEFARTVPVP